MEPCGTSTFNSGTLWNLVEPQLLRMEPLCGNLVEPCGTSTFKSGTFLLNLAEPGPRIRAAARNHPEALLEEPQPFRLLGKK